MFEYLHLASLQQKESIDRYLNIRYSCELQYNNGCCFKHFQFSLKVALTFSICQLVRHVQGTFHNMTQTQGIY